MDIDELGLPPELHRWLALAEIEYVEHLSLLSWVDLLKLPNFGLAEVEAIEDAMVCAGCALAEPPEGYRKHARRAE